MSDKINRKPNDGENAADVQEKDVKDGTADQKKDTEPATPGDNVEKQTGAADSGPHESGKDDHEDHGKGKLKKELRKLEISLKDAQKENEELKKKLETSEDIKLRVTAEYDNFRRRTLKEKEGIYADAYSDAVLSILPIIDNLELALKFGESDESRKGMEMIIKSAKETLEKMGVTEIEALGKTFDPNLHNAVMHTDDETKGENEIVQVLQKGYKLGDKVIRFAMVAVAN